MVTTYARMKVDPGRARTEPGPLGGSCRGTFPSLEPNKVVVGEILLLYSSPGVYRRQARCGTRGRTPCRARGGGERGSCYWPSPEHLCSLAPFILAAVGRSDTGRAERPESRGGSGWSSAGSLTWLFSSVPLTVYPSAEAAVTNTS